MSSVVVGKLFCWPHDPRQYKVRITAEYCNKQIKVVEENCLDKGSEFSKIFAKGQKVPAFYDDQLKMTVMESSGIAFHVAKMHDAKSVLLGQTKVEESNVMQWVLYCDTNVWSKTFSIASMYYAYEKLDTAKEESYLNDLKRSLTFMDKYLLHNTYLAAERITLADVVMACGLAWFYAQYCEEKQQSEYPNVLRWFKTCLNQPQFKKHYGEFKFCVKRDKPLQSPPQATKKAKPEAAAQEAKPVVEKKVKHPCESLPASKMVLDEWKRVYSNNDTRPTAIDWWWKNYDSAGYSAWHVNYKYNDELAQTFMSSNLVGGFYQRIERARKYAFGSMLVLGENNNNKIEGFFVFRGQEVLPEIIDAPDYPSFTFEKVDILDKKYKSKFEDFLAWDGASFATLKCADGKVFK